MNHGFEPQLGRPAMADDNIFINGFFAKAPHENAPEFVKAKINIKREELLQWLSARSDEWISVDIKESRSGKWYASVDDWQPNAPSLTNPSSSSANFASSVKEQIPPKPFEINEHVDFDDDSVPF
jgi:hypothetical protein